MSNRPKWTCVKCGQKDVVSLTTPAVPEKPTVTCECGYNKTLNEYINDRKPDRDQGNT